MTEEHMVRQLDETYSDISKMIGKLTQIKRSYILSDEERELLHKAYEGLDVAQRNIDEVARGCRD